MMARLLKLHQQPSCLTLPSTILKLFLILLIQYNIFQDCQLFPLPLSMTASTSLVASGQVLRYQLYQQLKRLHNDEQLTSPSGYSLHLQRSIHHLALPVTAFQREVFSFCLFLDTDLSLSHNWFFIRLTKDLTTLSISNSMSIYCALDFRPIEICIWWGVGSVNSYKCDIRKERISRSICQLLVNACLRLIYQDLIVLG